MHIFLPVLAIKRSNLEPIDRISVQTANVDIKRIRMRSRDVKRMYPTSATKFMLGDTRIKAISRQVIFSTQ